MAKPQKKLNLPLIEVIVGSLLLHIVAGIILGSVVLYQSLQEPEPDFVPPPEIKRVQPQRLEYKVKMQQQQKKSAKPRMKRIQVESPTNITVPQIDIVAPQVSSEVAVGSGMGGGSGNGDGLGAGSGLGMAKLSVNFFGVKNAGEKIFMIIDSTKYMLEDPKGGYPAFKMVKEEVAKLAGKVPPGILFNANMYGSGQDLWNPKLKPAFKGMNEEVAAWLAPINTDASVAGQVPDGYHLKNEQIEPMRNMALGWVRAMHSGFENQADSIFLLVSDWQWHTRFHYSKKEEKEAYIRKNYDWDDDDEVKYQNDLILAKAELDRQNKARRAKGAPERVVHSMNVIVGEMGNRIKPDPHFDEDEILKYVKNCIDHYYTKQGLPKPSINIVYFIGEDEMDRRKAYVKKNIDSFKRVSKAGRPGKFKLLEGFAGLQDVLK